jgi:molecular chaperone HscC
VKIYQGESLEPEKNLFLGDVTIPVPPLPKGESQVDVRFTYDINGILDVEVSCVQSGLSRSRVIVSNKNLDPETVSRRVTELRALRLSPREAEENQAIIALGERLYEEFTGAVRQRVVDALDQFKHVLDQGNPARIAKIRESVALFFAQLDAAREGLWDAAPFEYDDEEG